ncbi:hypothetical protein L6452_20316 [Arctium lappa]|uniref:Uncharacterized protein n=1 Tax=Arctium lappa TaxID=4217 RepID=A0ACB9BCX5_ARCLA|nr:hypothetical protein L6452_20316 [Arctium lappa]
MGECGIARRPSCCSLGLKEKLEKVSFPSLYQGNEKNCESLLITSSQHPQNPQKNQKVIVLAEPQFGNQGFSLMLFLWKLVVYIGDRWIEKGT